MTKKYNARTRLRGTEAVRCAGLQQEVEVAAERLRRAQEQMSRFVTDVLNKRDVHAADIANDRAVDFQEEDGEIYLAYNLVEEEETPDGSE